MPKRAKHRVSNERLLKQQKALESLVKKSIFPQLYFMFSIVVLALTSVYWSLLGAKIQLSNADNLVDAYLFKSWSTFHGATFPGEHTFLIKWPIFYVIKLFNFSNGAFITMTVLTVLVTVLGLAYLLYRIERRKLIIGTIFLALSSVLLLIPAQPYAGGILPVNMAMLTTRNLEYLVYIVSLVLIIKASKLISWRSLLATGLLTLLIASDRLFFTVGLVAAVLAIIVFTLAKKWETVSLSVNWLICQALAGGLAVLLLEFISAIHLTHISNGTTFSPYGFSSGSGIAVGIIYCVMGFFTNFGANPAFNATIVRHIPKTGFDRLFSNVGPGYLINFLLIIGGLFFTARLILDSIPRRTNDPLKPPTANSLAIMLLASTVTVLILFIGSNHYFAVDARYLTIGLFAVFIATTVYLRDKPWSINLVSGLGLMVVVGIIFGIFGALNTYNSEKTALATVNNRNSDIATILKNHPTDILVGDYWRVLPILDKAPTGTKIMPLADCTTARDDLSTTQWQPSLTGHSFAYLLTYDQKLTDYPSCTLNQVVEAYGRPNDSVLIAGTPTNPEEQLLFYDRGIHKSAPATNESQATSTVLPIALGDLPHVTCSAPTVLSIVAHQDDDLLFMNPDIINNIKKGYCERAVYVTAGDDGLANFYWLSRQRGSEAAYSKMSGGSQIWVTRIVQLSAKEYITVANPKGNSKISLVFINLPDGNLKGQGFPADRDESLAKLYAHQISVIHSVDGQSSYTLAQLTNALSLIMATYNPTEIYTQSTYPGTDIPDHSDHNTVGRLVNDAYKGYEQSQYNNLVTIPIYYYLGYPVHGRPPNVSGSALATKEAVFFAYSHFDSHTCQGMQECNSTVYSFYLAREYRNPY